MKDELKNSLRSKKKYSLCLTKRIDSNSEKKALFMINSTLLRNVLPNIDFLSCAIGMCFFDAGGNGTVSALAFFLRKVETLSAA